VPAALEPSSPVLGQLEAVPETAVVVPEVPQPLAGSSAAAEAEAQAVLAQGRGEAAAAQHGACWSCSASGASVYPCLADAGRGWGAVLPVLWHLVLPVAVMVAGAASCLSVLWLAIAALH